MSSVKRLEADKAKAATPTLHHETTHGTTYDADALAAKQAKDVYALMPWVDRDHDDHATKEQQEKEQKAKAEAKKAEEEKVRKQMDDAKAVAIATQLSAYSHSMDGATSRKFIQQLDAIDNPYLRAQVKARFADLSGRSLEGFITDCSDWNNNGDNRDKDAALALISDKRSDTERAIEKLPPAKREAMLADAHKRATKLRAARALHDTGDDNAKKMLNELAGCDPLEIEMMRKAVREQSMGEDNLYQAIDDGMKGKNEDAAVAMLTGDRVQSAHLELAATKDVGKMRERISKLTPDERMRLQVNPNTMAAIAALENPADREELQMALGGNAARADAVKLGNALKFKDEGYLMGGMGAKNDDRRSPAEVLKLFEGMPADQVKAAVAAWNEMNPLRPMESMLEARWGDDSDPTEMRRLQAMMKGDKALNAAIRVEQGIREDNQEMIEAALAHSGPEEKKKLMAAIAEEDRNTNEQRLIMSGHTPDQAKKLAKGRDAATQLNAYYDKLHAERTEKDNALGEFDLNDGMRAASEAGRKRLHDEIDDKRHAALELATDGKVSVATDMHRAKDDKAREEILNRLETDDELHQAIATYHDRHGKQMLPMDKDRSDMNALELRIDNIRRYGPVAKRPADLQAKLDYQLYKVAYSSSLEHDEAGRGGGGTQTMMRQALMWEQSKLQDPTIVVEHPPSWNDPMEALSKAFEEKPLPPLGMHRDPSAADIEADLPATKLFAKDGLKDEASRKDFDRAVSTNAAAGEAQQEAKKRLADRTVARLAMVAKIAGALTGNPLIAAAIMLGEGVAGMAIKNEILGRDYDPKEDLQALAIKLVAEAVSGGVAGKFGSFAGSMAKLGVNEVVGGVAQGKGVGDILLGLGTGALAASLPGALKERIKGVIATGNETLMRKVLGEVVAHVGEAGMSTVIAVAGGASVADAALDAGISMGGSLTQKAVKSGGHPTTTEHPHPSEHAPPSHASETHTPGHASESHAAAHPSETHAPAHPSETHAPAHPSETHAPAHPSETHAQPTDSPHPSEGHASTSPHPTEAHPATSLHPAEAHASTPRVHPVEAHAAPHASPTEHGDAHVVANGHHAEPHPAAESRPSTPSHTETPRTKSTHDHDLAEQIDRRTGVTKDAAYEQSRRDMAEFYANQEREAQHVTRVQGQTIEHRKDGSHYVVDGDYNVRRFEYDNGALTNITIDTHLRPGQGITPAHLGAVRQSVYRGTDEIMNGVPQGRRHSLPDGSKLHVEPVFHDEPSSAAHTVDVVRPGVDASGQPLHSNQKQWVLPQILNPIAAAHEKAHRLKLPDTSVDPTTYHRDHENAPGVTHDGSFMETVAPGASLKQRHLDQLQRDIDLARAARHETSDESIRGSSSPARLPADRPSLADRYHAELRASELRDEHARIEALPPGREKDRATAALQARLAYQRSLTSETHSERPNDDTLKEQAAVIVERTQMSPERVLKDLTLLRTRGKLSADTLKRKEYAEALISNFEALNGPGPAGANVHDVIRSKASADRHVRDEAVERTNEIAAERVSGPPRLHGAHDLVADAGNPITQGGLALGEGVERKGKLVHHFNARKVFVDDHVVNETAGGQTNLFVDKAGSYTDFATRMQEHARTHGIPHDEMVGMFLHQIESVSSMQTGEHAEFLARMKRVLFTSEVVRSPTQLSDLAIVFELIRQANVPEAWLLLRDLMPTAFAEEKKTDKMPGRAGGATGSRVVEVAEGKQRGYNDTTRAQDEALRRHILLLAQDPALQTLDPVERERILVTRVRAMLRQP